MPNQSQFKFGEFELDVQKRVLRKNGESVPLHAKSFDLLHALVENQGQVLSKDQLLDKVWPGQFVEEGNLSVQIFTLRKVFGERKDEHKFIVTVPGRGYSFVADVEVEDQELTVETHRYEEILVDEEVIDTAERRDVDPRSGPVSAARFKSSYVVLLVLPILTLLVGYWIFSGRGGTATDINSVAVMPFQNDGEGSDIEYLSDGLTESLINDLSRLPGLAVKARSSVFKYKGKDVSPIEAGRELNVRAVLVGRLVKQAGSITLYMSLVDTRTGDQVWGQQYDGVIPNAAALRTKVSSDVSHNLRAKLSTADEQKVSKTYTSNTEAYLLYMKGRYYWNRRTAPDLRKAIESFERATQLDPNYALAFAGLADSYSLLANFGGAPAIETKPKALTAALKALSIDDDLAEAHTSLGGILGDFNFDYVGEEREYKRAIEINPNYATARHWYGEMLTRNGRYEEAERELKTAIELDPLSLPIARAYADSLYYARRYEDSLVELRKIIELDPTFLHVYDSFATVYQTTGNHAACVESIAKVEELMGEAGFAEQMRRSFADGGWEGFLSEMTGDTRPGNLPVYFVAVFNAALGDKDAALASLERSYANREGFILWIKVDPRLDPLRDDSRFQDLMTRVGYGARE